MGESRVLWFFAFKYFCTQKDVLGGSNSDSLQSGFIYISGKVSEMSLVLKKSFSFFSGEDGHSLCTESYLHLKCAF